MEKKNEYLLILKYYRIKVNLGLNQTMSKDKDILVQILFPLRGKIIKSLFDLGGNFFFQ